MARMHARLAISAVLVTLYLVGCSQRSGDIGGADTSAAAAGGGPMADTSTIDAGALHYPDSGADSTGKR